MNNWPAVVSGFAALASASVAVLLYRWQSGPAWEAKLEANGDWPLVGSVLLVFSGHCATDVKVTVDQDMREFDVSVPERVARNGKVRAHWLAYRELGPPRKVTVTWRGRFGVRHIWRSGL